MRIHGQRWRFQLENSEVFVDNAFSWVGWTQERLVVNAETLQKASGWFSFRRDFDEDWLTPTGDGELQVNMRSILNGIECEVSLDGTPVEPDAFFEASWRGRGVWPHEDEWLRVDEFSIFTKLRPGK